MFCVTKVVCVVFLFRSFSHSLSLCFSESLTRPNFCSHCVSSFPTECLTSSNWNPPKTGYSHLVILSLSRSTISLVISLSSLLKTRAQSLKEEHIFVRCLCVSVYWVACVCHTSHLWGLHFSALCVYFQFASDRR